MTSPHHIALVNARIWTGNAKRPWADALLTNDDRIELLGTSAEVRKRIVPSAQVIDARGMLVAPGWTQGGGNQDDERLIEALQRMVRGATQADITVLEAGAVANLVILDRDITRAKPENVGDAKVVLLVEAGRVAHDRAGFL